MFWDHQLAVQTAVRSVIFLSPLFLLKATEQYCVCVCYACVAYDFGMYGI